MALVDNLISYWSLEDAIDTPGTNDLTDNNGVTFVSGKVGNAGSFPFGTSRYLSIANNTSLEVGDVDATWTCWVYLNSTSTAKGIFAKWAAANDGDYRLFHASGGAFIFTVRNSANSANAVATWGSNAAADTWYFVACRHDATANLISISVDAGTPVTAVLSGGTRISANGFAIGALNIASTFHNGLVDEFGFWKRYLSDAEITELYNGGSGRDYAYIAGGAGIVHPLFGGEGIHSAIFGGQVVR